SEQTFEYTPPEALLNSNWFQGSRSARLKYDIWSVGVVMLELMMGSPHVFQISDRTRILMDQHLGGWSEQTKELAYKLRSYMELCILVPGISSQHHGSGSLEQGQFGFIIAYWHPDMVLNLIFTLCHKDFVFLYYCALTTTVSCFFIYRILLAATNAATRSGKKTVLNLYIEMAGFNILAKLPNEEERYLFMSKLDIENRTSKKIFRENMNMNLTGEILCVPYNNIVICDHYTIASSKHLFLKSPRRTMLYPLTSVQYTTTPTFTMHAIIHYFRNQFLGFQHPLVAIHISSYYIHVFGVFFIFL
ncbi:hypothetical protein ACJX0J_014789, partial [Zea mays]